MYDINACNHTYTYLYYITFSFRMQIALVLLGAIALTRADDIDGFVPGFSVEQIFIPDDCTHRAREGDYMYQDYVGTLEDGSKFDSR